MSYSGYARMVIGREKDSSITIGSYAISYVVTDSSLTVRTAAGGCSSRYDVFACEMPVLWESI